MFIEHYILQYILGDLGVFSFVTIHELTFPRSPLQLGERVLADPFRRGRRYQFFLILCFPLSFSLFDLVMINSELFITTHKLFLGICMTIWATLVMGFRGFSSKFRCVIPSAGFRKVLWIYLQWVSGALTRALLSGQEKMDEPRGTFGGCPGVLLGMRFRS